MLVRLILAALLLAPMARAQAADNWADNADARADPAYAASRALCAAARATPLPRPKPGDAAPKGCSSETLFFGLGVPVDAAAARRCALGEQVADSDNTDAFGGTAMLTTIYATGKGAPRDLGRAIALACTLGGAPEEMDGRIRHLATLRKDGPGPSDFSFCDDVTSGANQGQCAVHDSAVAAIPRAIALDAIAAALPASDKVSFTAARKAAEGFAVARGENEVDLSGTARGAFAIEAQDAARDDFLELQQKLAAAKFPVVGAATADDDKALNTAYRAVMTLKDPQWGTPTASSIKATQRAWLTYRDALQSFVASRYGDAVTAAVVSWVTRRRTKELQAFLS